MTRDTLNGNFPLEGTVYSGPERRSRQRENGDIRNVFRLLGVDIEDQDSVNAFHDDLIYARKMRRLSEKGGMVVWGLILTAVVGGVVAVFTNGLRSAGR